jgi:hypothetical protein
MFKNLKVKIKNILTNWLGIDKITELFDKHMVHNYNSFERLNNLVYEINKNTRNELKQDISHFQDSVNALHNTVENVVHIGNDVCREPCGHSWAVICVEGKMNIVKFVDLNGKNARDIMHFLKQFETGRHCIDTPYREMFYDGLFKF